MADGATAATTARSDIPRRRGITEAWQVDGPLDHQTTLGPIQYSPQYSDDEFVYRHITVPRKVLRKTKELLSNQQKRTRASGQPLMLSSRRGEPLLPYEDIVTKLMIHMSNDWVLFLVHDRDCTLCFRRPRRDR